MTRPGPHRVDTDRPMTLVLAEIAHVLAPTDGFEERLRRALDLRREVVPYDRCGVVEAVRGDGPRIHLAPELSPSEEHELESALLRLLSLVSESTASPGDHTAGPERESLASYLAVPLVGSDGGAGLLLVSHNSADAYDEADLRLLSIVASQIATFLAASRPGVDEAQSEIMSEAPREAPQRRDGSLWAGVLPANALHLTKRQLEVARLIAAGRSNAQIAQELILTEGTVANHIEHILRRLGANNRAQVAAWVVERELRSQEPQR